MNCITLGYCKLCKKKFKWATGAKISQSGDARSSPTEFLLTYLNINIKTGRTMNEIHKKYSLSMIDIHQSGIDISITLTYPLQFICLLYSNWEKFLQLHYTDMFRLSILLYVYIFTSTLRTNLSLLNESVGISGQSLWLNVK